MKTAAFVLFAVVTAAAAALSTLVASRYLSLERDMSDMRAQLEDVQRERKHQEEEKIALRLEHERVQSDLEARFAGEHAALEECSNQRQEQFQEILANLATLQKRLTDLQALAAPSSPMEKGAAASPDAASAGTGPNPASPAQGAAHPDGTGAKAQPEKSTQAAPDNSGPKPARLTDVPKGTIPTPEQEAKALNKVQ